MSLEADLTAKTWLSKEHLSNLLSNDVQKENLYLTPTLDLLCYNKTFEEEMEEKRKLELAVNFLESFGIEVKTKYGFYRNINNVLEDLGECLDKIQNENTHPCQDCGVGWASYSDEGKKDCTSGCERLKNYNLSRGV